MKTQTTETTVAHTPGPWKLRNHGVNEPEYGHGVVHSHGGAHRFVLIEGVGELETIDMDIPKLEANARLIASAPELLAMCERLRLAMNPLLVELPRSSDDDEPNFKLRLKIIKLQSEAEQLILKAKGGK